MYSGIALMIVSPASPLRAVGRCALSDSVGPLLHLPLLPSEPPVVPSHGPRSRTSAVRVDRHTLQPGERMSVSQSGPLMNEKQSQPVFRPPAAAPPRFAVWVQSAKALHSLQSSTLEKLESQGELAVYPQEQPAPLSAPARPWL